jgi:hypothetical protein
MEVTDVGGDEQGEWGETGGQTGFDTIFDTGFDTGDGDGDGDGIAASIAQCQDRCDRELICGLIDEVQHMFCQGGCQDQVLAYASSYGPPCVDAFFFLNQCAVFELSCSELDTLLSGGGSTPCDVEEAVYQLYCSP